VRCRLALARNATPVICNRPVDVLQRTTALATYKRHPCGARAFRFSDKVVMDVNIRNANIHFKGLLKSSVLPAEKAKFLHR